MKIDTASNDVIKKYRLYLKLGLLTLEEIVKKLPFKYTTSVALLKNKIKKDPNLTYENEKNKRPFLNLPYKNNIDIIKSFLIDYNISIEKKVKCLDNHADKLTYINQNAMFINDENNDKYLLIIENNVSKTNGYLVPYGQYKVEIYIEENREYFSKFIYDQKNSIKVKKIENLERYFISNDGRVISTRKGTFIKPSMSGGYKQVGLYNNILNITQTFRVHRLVAQAYIPNPENKPEVNHIDGIKTNNHALNLEWVTSSENKLHAYKIGLQVPKKGENSHRAKLTTEQIIKIRKLFNLKIMNVVSLSKLYNVSIRTIWNILEYKIYKDATNENNLPKYTGLTRVERHGENHRIAQLSNAQANEIRELYINKHLTIPKLAELYNVKNRVIWKVLQYSTYKTNDKYSKIYKVRPRKNHKNNKLS